LNWGICRRPGTPLGCEAIQAAKTARAPSASSLPPYRFQTLPSSGAK
jgi:hypothetical protein